MKQLRLFLFVSVLMMCNVAYAVIGSGTCGESVTWTLNDDYSLVIEGSGAMEEYITYSKIPWYDNRTSIKSAKIAEGVTSIGRYMFFDCSNLNSVTIPNTVTSIGQNAFYHCGNLNSVTIPSSVTSIGDGAFNGCSSFRTVTIPNTVKSIGSYMFTGCSNLDTVTIPNSVTSIGDYAFNGCINLHTVTIPNSVTSIGKSAFYDCSSLNAVTIPKSVTTIGLSAFYGCSNLTSFIVDKDNANYSSEENVLYNKDKTTLIFCTKAKKGDIIIPNTVTSIAGYAFLGCDSLTCATIPNSVTSIEERSFEGCSSLTSFIVDKDNLNYSSEGNVLYNKDKTTLIFCTKAKKGDFIIPNTVTSIAGYAFLGCDSLTCVTIPNSVTTIGWAAFKDCNSLNSVTIPNSVTNISDWAFYRCNNLNSVTIGNSMTSIGGYAFAETSIRKFYVIGDEMPTCKSYVFEDVILDDATLYVSEAKIAEYKTAQPWSGFGKILSINESGIEDGIKIIEESANLVLITSRDGVMHISGLDEGETAQIFAIDGKKLGETTDRFVTTRGRIVIVRIGQHVRKVIVK